MLVKTGYVFDNVGTGLAGLLAGGLHCVGRSQPTFFDMKNICHPLLT
jgi:hypothetical protein